MDVAVNSDYWESPAMHAHPLFAAFILVASGCGSGANPATGTSTGAAPTPEAQAWLDAQNAVRRNVQPAPTAPLPALTWSGDAAAVAQAWASGCTFSHNPERGNRGENIAANAPAGSWGVGDAVSSWAGEAQSYDYATNTCASGQVCGHYTQIVWRDTTRVGCAHTTCSTGSPFGPTFPTWDFWVCDYEPPGNDVGERPY